MRFDGQPILISGAGRGLGEGIARHLAGEGAVVGIADVNGPSAHDVAAAIGAAGGKAFAYEADLGRRQAFFDVAEAFARDAGPLRAVINNASVLVYEPIEAVTEETLDRMLSAGPMVCVESFSTGKTLDGLVYENDYCWVFEVSNGKIDAMREYMDSHYTAKLFGMD